LNFHVFGSEALFKSDRRPAAGATQQQTSILARIDSDIDSISHQFQIRFNFGVFEKCWGNSFDIFIRKFFTKILSATPRQNIKLSFKQWGTEHVWVSYPRARSESHAPRNHLAVFDSA
jgi:hypothetical protein